MRISDVYAPLKGSITISNQRFLLRGEHKTKAKSKFTVTEYEQTLITAATQLAAT